jgi:hypothetical protein
MTQERFIQILDDPALLADISYEELKTLTLAYPSTHNLRVLLALKARQINHPEYDKQLAAAAAHSLDRTRLFHLMTPEHLVQRKDAAHPEEVLELKPIADLQRALDVKIPVEKNEVISKQKSVETEASESRSAVQPVSEDRTSGSAAASDKLTGPAQPLQRSCLVEEVPGNGGQWIRISALPVLRQAAETAGSEDSSLSAHTALPDTAHPYGEVKEALSGPGATSAEVQYPENKPKQGLSAQELAERSVQLKEEVASETLARLLARQGYRDKAVVMYEKLRLLFPEKSDYFAAEIQKLKK